MEKQELKTVEAVQMELSDMIEKLIALHEYLTDFLNLERKTNVKNSNHTK